MPSFLKTMAAKNGAAPATPATSKKPPVEADIEEEDLTVGHVPVDDTDEGAAVAEAEDAEDEEVPFDVGALPEDDGSLTATPATKAAAKPPAKAVSGAQPSKSWMMRGAQSAAELKRIEELAAERKEAAGRAFRFSINKRDFGSEFPITFLDGSIGESGLLELPQWYEHKVQLGGRWETIVCLETVGLPIDEPCPVCKNSTDNRPMLVGAMTVINHTPHTVQNGPNKGKTLTDRRQLFVCTLKTIKLLSKIAAKNGNTLAGIRFDVSRSSGEAPRVGDLFQPVSKTALTKLKALYGDEAVPFNYEEEVQFRDAAQLEALGFNPNGPAQVSNAQVKGNFKNSF